MDSTADLTPTDLLNNKTQEANIKTDRDKSKDIAYVDRKVNKLRLNSLRLKFLQSKVSPESFSSGKILASQRDDFPRDLKSKVRCETVTSGALLAEKTSQGENSKTRCETVTSGALLVDKCSQEEVLRKFDIQEDSMLQHELKTHTLASNADRDQVMNDEWQWLCR